MDGSDDRNESSLFLDRNLTFFSKQIQAIRFVWIGVLMIPSWAAPLSLVGQRHFPLESRL
jgi:hypothetical protein